MRELETVRVRQQLLQKPRQLQSWVIFNFKCLEGSCLISGRVSDWKVIGVQLRYV